MKRITKIASHLLAVGLFLALLVFNVQLGTPKSQAKAVSVPKAKADLTVTCGTDYKQECFTYNDGINFIYLKGGVKNVTFY